MTVSLALDTISQNNVYYSKTIHDMNSVMNDIWPFLLTAVLTAIGGYIGYIHSLKTRVAVVEKTIEGMMKTIDNIQERQNSHSKKQDDILHSLHEMKLEVLRQIAAINANMGGLSSDVKNIQNLIKQQ